MTATRLAEPLVVAAAIAWFLYATTGFRGVLIDDAYMFFRYAEHLAAGNGLVWNVGEPPVQGFTSIAWVLLLAAGTWLTGAPAAAVALKLGVTVGVAGLILAWRATRNLLPPGRRCLAAFAPLMLGATPVYARHAVSGMETMLAAAVLLAIAALWGWSSVTLRSRVPWLALMSFVAFTIRPDALIPCVAGTMVLIALDAAPDRLRLLCRYGCWLAVPLAADLIATDWVFGSIVPLPAFMKLRIGAALTSVKLLRWIIYDKLDALSRFLAPLVVAVLPFLARPARPAAPIAAIAVAVLAYALFLLMILPIMDFEARFELPLFGLIALLATVGAATLLDGIRMPSAILTLIVLGSFGAFHTVRLESATICPSAQNNEHLGRVLAAYPDLFVAGSESGAIPYLSRARFLDLGGLNDRFIAINRTRPDINARFEAYLLHGTGLPDVYLDPADEYGFALMANHETLAAQYDRVDADGYRIYLKHDTVPAALRTILSTDRAPTRPGLCRDIVPPG